MKEYIERDAFVSTLRRLRKGFRRIDEKCAVDACILEAEDTPAADVVERKRGEWVSVEERLPNIHQRVLVWCESKTIQKHVTTCTFMADYSGKGKGPYFSRHVRNVTHWMPLPEPPKGG